jgi:hypothetical protein
VKLSPRAQLRRDLNSGKVKQEPRTEDEKQAARAERKRALREALEQRTAEDGDDGE